MGGPLPLAGRRDGPPAQPVPGGGGGRAGPGPGAGRGLRRGGGDALAGREGLARHGSGRLADRARPCTRAGGGARARGGGTDHLGAGRARRLVAAHRWSRPGLLPLRAPHRAGGPDGRAARSRGRTRRHAARRRAPAHRRARSRRGARGQRRSRAHRRSCAQRRPRSGGGYDVHARGRDGCPRPRRLGRPGGGAPHPPDGRTRRYWRSWGSWRDPGRRRRGGPPTLTSGLVHSSPLHLGVVHTIRCGTAVVGGAA